MKKIYWNEKERRDDLLSFIVVEEWTSYLLFKLFK